MLGLGTGFYGVGGDMDLKGSWLPTDESSLLAWYKFGTPTKNPVDVWPDSSGNGYHMLQATSANQPTISSGIITFDGVDDFLALASGHITLTNDEAFLIAFRVHPTNTNIIVLGETGSGTEMVKFLNIDTIRIKPGGANADYQLSSGGITDDAYWVLSREAGAADLTTVLKDGSQVDATIAAPGEFNISQIGRRTHGSQRNDYQGEIYEIIIFNETNATLIANVTARLAGL